MAFLVVYINVCVYDIAMTLGCALVLFLPGGCSRALIFRSQSPFRFYFCIYFSADTYIYRGRVSRKKGRIEARVCSNDAHQSGIE